MTAKDFLDNIQKGFTAKEEGFSVKKMLAVVAVITLLVLTGVYTDQSNWQSTLTIWLGFVTSILAVGAVEKKIASNDNSGDK